MRSLRSALFPARLPYGDEGLSLIEMMVAVGLMSVVLALFGTGMTQIFSAGNNNQALTVATQQLHNAFIRLDRNIRYASGISKPGAGVGVAAGNTYVEYELTNTGTSVCTQLALVADSRQPGVFLLQTRSKTGSGAVSGWSTMASDLTSASSFSRLDATTAVRANQQLTIALTAQEPGNADVKTDTVTFAFTALNTSTDTTSDTVCSADLKRNGS
jgi:prepilin-type N-terminal cleavage/methylation domain-containing protein